jgi:hypothetical protein
MSNLTQSHSPFNAIRKIDDRGNEFWSARDLMHLTGFHWESSSDCLSRKDASLAILEAAARIAMGTYPGGFRDSHYLYDQAMSLYRGQEASMIFHGVRTLIQLQFQREFYNENQLYPHIQRYQDVLGLEGSLTPQVTDSCGHRPDFILKENGKIIPVEVKRVKFDRAALVQLERYMSHLQSQEGVAIASELCVSLPKRVRFVKINNEMFEQLTKYVPLEERVYNRYTELQDC